MWPYPNRTVGKIAVASFACVAISCGIIDLRPVVVSVEPDDDCPVLQSRDASLKVGFSAEPIRIEAERAFSVESPRGTVDGDFAWEGRGFFWKPVRPWDPGMRYRLRLHGSIRTACGREARPEIDLPFYVLRSSAPPTVVSSSPEAGASTGTGGDGRAFIELMFSEPMDRDSFREAFSLVPAADYRVSWNSDGTVASIVPDGLLSSCAVYRWKLGTEARAVDGAPLAAGADGCFVTDLDRTAPRVDRAYPVVYSGGTWVEAGSGLGAVDSGHSLAVLFSEPVDPGSALSGIRVEPGRPGWVAAVSNRLFVYTPGREWEPAENLSLVVSADVADLSGLGMSGEFRAAFTPVVPFLELLSVTGEAGETSGDFGGRAVLPVTIGVEPDGLLTLTLGFSASFDAAAKVATAAGVGLSAFFPLTLPAPRLRGVCWFSDDTVSLTWEGLRPSGPASTSYYALTVPGGRGGVTSGAGLRLEADATIHIEVKP